jgi:hypothetical protein
MGTKKQRKARRRVEKTMEQAWEAMEAGDLALAEKLSRRAINDGKINPRIWNDHGLILQMCDQFDEAANAFRYAVTMAPNYTEALSNLAKLLTNLGQVAQAVRVQRRVTEFDPSSTEAQELLRTYEALVPAAFLETEARESATQATARTSRYNWLSIEEELTRVGCAHLAGLLIEEECRELAGLFANDENFEHTVACNDHRGAVTYRFFKPPLPDRISKLRTEVYFRLAPIVNRWLELLKSADRFPTEFDAFRRICAAAGQSRSSPILLHYSVGGFNALHRDISGKVFFPLQLAVTLGPSSSADGGGGTGGGGGEFMLVDEGPGKKAVTTFATGIGDAVLFCTRHRLAKVGGLHGWQSVHHGLTRVLLGERYALGVPFHEYAGNEEAND